MNLTYIMQINLMSFNFLDGKQKTWHDEFILQCISVPVHVTTTNYIWLMFDRTWS